MIIKTMLQGPLTLCLIRFKIAAFYTCEQITRSFKSLHQPCLESDIKSLKNATKNNMYSYTCLLIITHLIKNFNILLIPLS